MAEQSIDETKSPATRRVARPFIGPAGAPSPARPPILRPAAPAAGPAMPAHRAPRSPLAGPASGSSAATAAPAIASAEGAAVAVSAAPATEAFVPPPTEPVLADFEPGSASDAAFEPGPTPGAAAEPPDGSMVASAPTALRGAYSLGAPVSGFDVIPALGLPVVPGTDVAPPELDARVLPNEPIAMPAWLEDDAVPPSAQPNVEHDVAAGYDRVAGHDAMAEREAHVDAEPALDWAVPEIPSADDVIAEAPATTGGLADTAAGSAEALAGAPGADGLAAAEGNEVWPDSLAAEYAPYVSPPEGLYAASSAEADHARSLEPGHDSASEARGETNDDGPASHATAGETSDPADRESLAAVSAPTEAPEWPGLAPAALEGRGAAPAALAAAVLDRLADRVRAGEIDVSSMAPEATDAAVLASVLAGLLGGSSRR